MSDVRASESAASPVDPDRPVDGESASTESTTVVDPRASRFRGLITAIVLALGVVVASPEAIYLATALLLVGVLTRHGFDPYGYVWRVVLIPRLMGYPPVPKSAPPYRFAHLLHAVGGIVASGALLVDEPGAGYAVAGAVAGLTALAALGFCVGCTLYRRVAFVRSLNLVPQ